jgi:hypothetical protein
MSRAQNLGLPLSPTAASSAPSDEPFQSDWRIIKAIAPDGSETYERIPLTLEDRLFPEG